MVMVRSLSWMRIGISAVVFAILSALVEFFIFGDAALFSIKGIIGIAIQKGIFLALMACTPKYLSRTNSPN